MVSNFANTSLFNFNSQQTLNSKPLVQVSNQSSLPKIPLSQSTFSFNTPSNQQPLTTLQQSSTIPPQPTIVPQFKMNIPNGTTSNLPQQQKNLIQPQIQPQSQHQSQTLSNFNFQQSISQTLNIGSQHNFQPTINKTDDQIRQPNIGKVQKNSTEESYVGISNLIQNFTTHLNDFKQNINKLFSGKDLTKCLLNLSVIKDTKIAQDRFDKLMNEIKVFIYILKKEKCFITRKKVT